MWDTVDQFTHPEATHLSRELPCRTCGHAAHTFLACSDSCDCAPPVGLPVPAHAALPHAV